MHLNVLKRIEIYFFLGILVCTATLGVDQNGQTYVVNGIEAPLTPYHAHLLIQPGLGSPEIHTFVGSGALITQEYVLTCGQNLFGFNYFRVGVGSVHRSNLTFFRSMNKILHPAYDYQNLNNNIGFIVLNEPIQFTDGIQPIALPRVNAMLPFPSEQGIFTGFGMTNGDPNKFSQRLHRGFHRVLPTIECHRRYPHLASRPGPENFCGLDDQPPQSNICGGDQGGPFVILVRGVWTLVGVASFTERNCIRELGAVYVRITAYRQWILQTIGT